MKTLVLDSWPILEWIAGRQPASKKVAEVLVQAEENRARLFMSAINAGEVFYCLRKNHSQELAETWRQSSRGMPITFDTPALADIWNAATIKAEFPIAYGDAFAVALARKHACPLMTGDPELRLVNNLVLDWIGR